MRVRILLSALLCFRPPLSSDGLTAGTGFLSMYLRNMAGDRLRLMRRAYTLEDWIMNHSEQLKYLNDMLLTEMPQYREQAWKFPKDDETQKKLFRSLVNVRPPMPAEPEFLKVQDLYLQEEIRQKGVTDLKGLTPIQKGIYLWKGDITTLRCDAIVNAANSQMLGCFVPCHGCIDNAIHTFAGVQLRLACAEIMRKQGYKEKTGRAKITPAFNLPCRYILHTVGPVVGDRVTPKDEELLASCYRSCLESADRSGVKSIAFCCISTGEFHFPNERAAETAVKTVQDYRQSTQSKIEVIFNVFKERDLRIYRNLLRTNQQTETRNGNC